MTKIKTHTNLFVADICILFFSDFPLFFLCVNILYLFSEDLFNVLMVCSVKLCLMFCEYLYLFCGSVLLILSPMGPRGYCVSGLSPLVYGFSPGLWGS